MTVQTLPIKMSASEAEQVTSRIKVLFASTTEAIEKIKVLIDQAEAGEAWRVLEYPSWTAYFTAEFSVSVSGLEKALRGRIIEVLADQGMSTRAIGEVVGVSKDTVSRDLRAGVSSETPGPTPCTHCEGALELPSTTCGNTSHVNGGLRGHLGLNDEPKKTTGLDGKAYTRPEPRPPRRRPLPDSYRDRSYDLLKAVESVERLHMDDRLAANKETLLERNRFALLRAHEKLTAICAELGVDTGAEPPAALAGGTR